MFGSETVEVILGLALVFALVSTLCSVVREGIESLLKTRAAYLEHGIRELLRGATGSDLAQKLFEHPLISGLYSGDYQESTAARKRPGPWTSGKNFPSYIPSRNFAMALLDLAARGADPKVSSKSEPISLDAIRDNIGRLDNEHVARALLAHLDAAEGSIERARANVEAWYDSAMDRVAGWYRRSTQWMIFGIAIVVVAALNVNVLVIAKYLYAHDTERGVVISTIESAKPETPQDKGTYEDAVKRLEALQLPIGWDGADGSGNPWEHAKAHPLTTFLGLLITALAATLGAPFWFDVLNKVMVIRSTVKPTEKSKDESSKDAQRGDRSTRETTAAEDDVSTHRSVQRVRADNDVAHDGCGVGVVTPTRDEDLPAAEGGVAAPREG